MSKTDSVEIAEFLGTGHDGERVPISSVNSLDSAGPEELSFCVYEDEDYIEDSDAGAIICFNTLDNISDSTLIRSSNPRLDFVLVVNEYFLKWPDKSEIHPSAVISEEAEIGDRCLIGPNVYIGPNVFIGNKCKIQAGTSIGGEGFGFFPDNDGTLHKQMHKGGVIIEDNVEIGSNCSVDRAVFDKTVIGHGTKMDNLIHVAHNVTIGESTWIADTVGIQGSVTVGDRVRVHPNASIADHTTVGDDVEVAMNAAVLDDVESGDTVAGIPASSIN